MTSENSCRVALAKSSVVDRSMATGRGGSPLAALQSRTVSHNLRLSLEMEKGLALKFGREERKE